MDIARPDLLEKKKKRRLAWAAAGAGAVVLLTLGVSRLRPAAPTVERSTVVIDTVKRGEMVREVRGLAMQARLRADADAELAKNGLIAGLALKLSQSAAEELEHRESIEQQRLGVAGQAIEA